MHRTIVLVIFIIIINSIMTVGSRHVRSCISGGSHYGRLLSPIRIIIIIIIIIICITIIICIIIISIVIITCIILNLKKNCLTAPCGQHIVCVYTDEALDRVACCITVSGLSAQMPRVRQACLHSPPPPLAQDRFPTRSVGKVGSRPWRGIKGIM